MEMFVIREKGILDNYYFKIFNGKEYWNEKECTGNFVHRKLADMYPRNYERYRKESMEFKESIRVLWFNIINKKWRPFGN